MYAFAATYPDGGIGDAAGRPTHMRLYLFTNRRDAETDKERAECLYKRGCSAVFPLHNVIPPIDPKAGFAIAVPAQVIHRAMVGLGALT